MTNIVVVEDDDLVRKSLAFFLKSKGYDLVEFDNGLDAIDHINKNHGNIQLVITDLNLPFAGGQQVLHACKSISGNKLPVIVLTSSGVEHTEVEVFDLGADDFVSKPFSPSALLKRIEKLTGKE